MSRISGKDTKPEMVVRRYLFASGFRYKLHDRRLPGSPDLVFPKYKSAIFVNGCFWHGHANCKYFKLPKTRTAWWQAKIRKNVDRDRKNVERLKAFGWKVIVVWECQLKPGKKEKFLECLAQEIVKNNE
jgi:DNA mismatch endonuclease (patch repair protein)